MHFSALLVTVPASVCHEVKVNDPKWFAGPGGEGPSTGFTRITLQR
jgi:hypothetical protein